MSLNTKGPATAAPVKAVPPVPVIKGDPSHGSTAFQVISSLRDMAVTLDADVNSNMAKLKAAYVAKHGGVNLDKFDWHWIATTLKNRGVADAQPTDPASPKANPALPAHAAPASSSGWRPSGYASSHAAKRSLNT